jgi:hypothetical protein
LESVPPVTTTRWIPRRKAQVVRAIEAGLLSPEEARRLYCLSEEELESWQRTLRQVGEPGLRVTRRLQGWEAGLAAAAANL